MCVKERGSDILNSDVLPPIECAVTREGVKVPENAVQRGDGQEELARGVDRE